MKKMKSFFVWALLLMPIAGCSDEAESPVEAVDAKLVAIIEGKEKEMTVFEENSDIRFYLKLINNSSEDIEVGDRYGFCELYNEEEYLLIYKWAKNDGDEKERWIPLGKPYISPVMCPDIFLPLAIPANGDVGVAAASWSQNSDNIPLGPGKYYTALSYTLDIGGESKNLDLKLEFEVQ